MSSEAIHYDITNLDHHHLTELREINLNRVVESSYGSKKKKTQLLNQNQLLNQDLTELNSRSQINIWL